MKTAITKLYLLAAMLLFLHLVFAVAGYYFYKSFEADLEARAAEFPAIQSQLQEIDETQLNKDLVLEVLTTNLQDSETFVQLFAILAELSLLATLLCVALLLQIHKGRGMIDEPGKMR